MPGFFLTPDPSAVLLNPASHAGSGGGRHRGRLSCGAHSQVPSGGWATPGGTASLSERPSLPLASAEVRGNLRPFLLEERLRLPPLELAAVHAIGPGQAHRHLLGEVAEALPHPVE